ncbi:single-stranded DNA-binding protein [Aphanothece hegewaldii CCALA 016]|uniref:Single-stranded DNA-binding protein n=1 Tax=Aphanothece hegewaldii CCALA 016 TaxID=2107694 RepID=A0A2T1LY02_9CHRO|nr:single-stranded DNA-binding protein [Aphanothece hegewaldii]PSF37244.1 single-stranded DNA-binding protein [Aphanothece hegewaldii CCALA 016]
MNSFVLMAKIIRSPELRYTQDKQTPIAQMLVEFEGQKPEEPSSTLKVVGWGNLATEITEKYTEGDRVIIEGRLSMNVLDRPEGYKEKRAELVVSHIYHLDHLGYESSYTPTSTATASPKTEKVVPMNAYKNKTTEPAKEKDFDEPIYETNFSASQPVAANVEQDLDDIPF